MILIYLEFLLIITMSSSNQHKTVKYFDLPTNAEGRRFHYSEQTGPFLLKRVVEEEIVKFKIKFINLNKTNSIESNPNWKNFKVEYITNKFPDLCVKNNYKLPSLGKILKEQMVEGYKVEIERNIPGDLVITNLESNDVISVSETISKTLNRLPCGFLKVVFGCFVKNFIAEDKLTEILVFNNNEKNVVGFISKKDRDSVDINDIDTKIRPYIFHRDTKIVDYSIN